MNLFLWNDKISRKIDLVAKMVGNLKDLVSRLLEEGNKFDGFDADNSLKNEAKRLGIEVKEREEV